MIYIDQVHYLKDSHGCSVIGSVKWTQNFNELSTSESTKQTMIDFIKQNPNCTKTKYKNYGAWSLGENVMVVDNSYLRTDSNGTKADNLENLIEY